MSNCMRAAFAAALFAQVFFSLAVDAEDVVALTVCEMPSHKEGDDWYRPSALEREVVRQGFLIVAREDFGLTTRDEALGESFETASKPKVMELNVSLIQGKEISFELLENGTFLVKAEASYAYRHDRSTIASIAKSVVFDFRDEYTTALTKTGFAPKPVVESEPSKEKLEEIDVAIKHMSVFSQYHAARICHAELATNGQSAEVIGRLARCYANLSQLTAHYLTHMRSVFAARAIVYATELLRIYPDSATGYLNQAYVFSILGLSKHSMWQLERLESLAQLKQDDQPEWMYLVELANEFSFATLAELSGNRGEDWELATLLMFRSAEHCGSQSLSVKSGKRALKSIPSCLRILHGMDRTSGTRLRHTTTVLPDKVLENILSPALQPLRKDNFLAPVVPEEGVVVSARQRVGLVKSLKELSKTDHAEPSVAVLGRIVENLDCLHIAMRINFLQFNLGVDASDYVKQTRELFADHEFAELFEYYAIDWSDTSRKSSQLKKIPLLHANYLSSWLIINKLPHQAQLMDRTAKELHDYTFHASGAFEPDYTIKLNASSGDGKLRQAKWMSDIHPNSPKRTATMVELDWEYASSRVDRWLKASNRHPTLVGALAAHYETAGELKRAEALWDEAIASAPDYQSYDGLARLLYRRGAKEESLDAVKVFLKEEDFGLSHAAISNSVAHTLMAEGDFEAALPWAKRAGSSYAAWARETLAYCQFKLGAADKAAEILAEIDEQYTIDLLYRFNIQSGRSAEEFEQAWKLKAARIGRYAAGNSNRHVELAIHEVISGEIESAVESMGEAVTADGWPIHLAYLSFTQHFAEQKKERDKTLRMITELETEDDDFAELAKTVAKFIQNGDADLPTLKTAAMKLHDSGEEESFSSANFFIGFMYECLEDDARAIKHYKQCAKGHHENSLLLACHRLRELKSDVPEWRIKLSGFQE